MLTPITKAEQALQLATTPRQSKQVEALAAAAKAWAKEQDDFEMVVEAGRIYILARRRTTELIRPTIKQGRPENKPNDTVRFIKDYGFTQMQWNRRTKELEVTDDEIDEYIDDCIVKQYAPTVWGLLRFVSQPHVTQNTGNNEWYTPSEYIEAARQVMGGIDLDPASSKQANEIVGASVYFTEEDDGLQYHWSGRVWMNPPYSSELIKPFCKKLAQHVRDGDIEQAIVLVNNATETNWFGELIDEASAVVFPKGRIRFIDCDGNPSGAPLQGQSIIYCGTYLEKFIDIFSKFGWGAIL